MMRVCLAVLAAVATASASPVAVGGNFTNVCNLDWTYCPRDPGCVTYTMSVDSVTVFAPEYSSPVKAEDLKAGDKLYVTVKGETTLTSVPVDGSYKIYSLSGKNVGSGALADSMTIDAPYFTLHADFTLDADCMTGPPQSWFEFGIDVFQEGSGSDEAFCVQIQDKEFLAYEKADPSPPFEMYCKDEGGGHFVKEIVKLEGHDIPSARCGAPPPPPPGNCALEWYYCPRDPGCVTYDMTVQNVEVDVHDKTGIKAGDTIDVKVTGQTQLRSVPVEGSIRIYALSGKNEATFVLTDVCTIDNCVSEGCDFSIDLSFVLQDDSFLPSRDWFEFGMDVFREKSETLESMCVEIANPTYIDYEETHPQAPPGFEMLCKPESWGHFKSTPAGTPENPQDVVCKLV